LGACGPDYRDVTRSRPIALLRSRSKSRGNGNADQCDLPALEGTKRGGAGVGCGPGMGARPSCRRQPEPGPPP
jgi:hypothetical protein